MSDAPQNSHEAHDRVTKRRWYAEFGVANYWLLDVFGRSLECLVLDGGEYRADAAGPAPDRAQADALVDRVSPRPHRTDQHDVRRRSGIARASASNLHPNQEPN